MNFNIYNCNNNIIMKAKKTSEQQGALEQKETKLYQHMSNGGRSHVIIYSSYPVTAFTHA